jgi:hypothetical protein
MKNVDLCLMAELGFRFDILDLLNMWNTDSWNTSLLRKTG